jgi:hypothetical protein
MDGPGFFVRASLALFEIVTAPADIVTGNDCVNKLLPSLRFTKIVA